MTIGISDALDVIGETPWHQTVQASINEQSQLEVNVFRSQCNTGVTCSD